MATQLIAPRNAEEAVRMAGIDYREVRARIPMSRVLELLGYQPKTRQGHQLRGPCPIQESSHSQSDIFAVHLGKHAYYCHHCKSGGDQLKLWQAIHKRPLYAATLDLCRAARIEVPWLKPAPDSRCKSPPPRSPRNR